MWDDARVLEIYIHFIVESIPELDRLIAQEKDLRSNLSRFNRKNNLEIIKNGYQQYLESLKVEWEKIYISSSHYSETLNNYGLLTRNKTIYAISLVQRHIEQFYFHLFDLIRPYVKYFDEDTKDKRFDKNGLTDEIWFSYTERLMKDIFKLVLYALKSNTLNIREQELERFVEINQKHIKDITIRYRTGDNLSAAQIDQMLEDIAEQEQRRSEEFEKGIQSGDIRINLPTYETEKALKIGLERESCSLLARIIRGSYSYYDSLSVLPVIDPNEEFKLIIDIDLMVSRTGLSKEKTLDLKETNAMYMGLAAGYAYENNMLFNFSFVSSKFLNKSIPVFDVSKCVLSFIGVISGSEEALKINNLNDEMKRIFTTDVLYATYEDSKNITNRTSVAMNTAFKLGYHAYFRLVGILPGNTFEEDQIIFNQFKDKKGKRIGITINKPEAVGLVNNSVNKSTTVKTEIITKQESAIKYWLTKDGKIECPGDNCSETCSVKCPIYLQTLAFTKLKENKIDEAAKLLSDAVYIEPSFADAWNNLAACYGQMGDHKNAFAAYQRSYEILQKPNPLFGMAVATKCIGDNTLSEIYIDMYIKKFGLDDRIKALRTELHGNVPLEKTDVENKETVSPKKTISINEQLNLETHTFSHLSHKENQTPESTVDSQNIVSEMSEVKDEPVSEQEKDNETSSGNDAIQIEDMRRYGKYMFLLMDPDTREAGYMALEKMEDGFPEAAINVGQYYNGIDKQKAKEHFKIAADKGIAEALWDYSQLLPHTPVLDLSNIADKEYLKYCLAAAEGGCPDAANEMGNICYRKKFYEESTYWYGMAYFLGHPDGMISLKGITKEWQENGGISQDYEEHIDGFSEERHSTALMLYKMFNQSLDKDDYDALLKLSFIGENLAGFIVAQNLEQNNKDELTYKVFNVLRMWGHPHALRCHADMLIAGKGTDRDVEAAFEFYEKAAKAGNEASMFVMGQKAAKAGDKYLAACWFGQAYSRGYEMAGEWLMNLNE